MTIFNVSELSETHELFNTIIKEFPNGDIKVKKLKNMAMKKKNGIETKDIEMIFKDKESANDKAMALRYGNYLWQQHKEKFKKAASEITLEKIEIPVTEEREAQLLAKRIKNVTLTRSKIYDIANANEWTHFLTLTFNEKKVDRYSFEECTKKCLKFMNNFTNRNKDTCPNFKYILIHEKHKDGAFHYHGLIYLDNTDTLVDGGKRTIDGQVIFNWNKWTNGWSTVTKIVDQERCVKYILKYINKDINTYDLGRRRFFYSSNCDKPTVTHEMTASDEYASYDPVYDTIYSTGYDITKHELLTNLFGDMLVIDDDE